MKDAARLVYTLNVMTKDEAQAFNIAEENRWSYVRMDKGKVNITPPSRQARWFKLIGISIGNADDTYKSGDEVQTVEQWFPPEVMGGINEQQMDEILDRIHKGLDNGRRYSDAPTAKTRAAWKVVVDVVPKVNEKQAREIVKMWVKTKVLVSKPYRNEADRKDEDGLWKGEGFDMPF